LRYALLQSSLVGHLHRATLDNPSSVELPPDEGG